MMSKKFCMATEELKQEAIKAVERSQNQRAKRLTEELSRNAPFPEQILRDIWSFALGRTEDTYFGVRNPEMHAHIGLILLDADRPSMDTLYDILQWGWSEKIRRRVSTMIIARSESFFFFGEGALQAVIEHGPDEMKQKARAELRKRLEKEQRT
jgi:hypothetical protein